MARTESVPKLTRLGEYIRHRLIECGMSHAQLARECGTNKRQLWRIMYGRAGPLDGDMLLRLEYTLGEEAMMLGLLDIEQRIADEREEWT